MLFEDDDVLNPYGPSVRTAELHMRGELLDDPVVDDAEILGPGDHDDADRLPPPR